MPEAIEEAKGLESVLSLMSKVERVTWVELNNELGLGRHLAALRLCTLQWSVANWRQS